MHMYIYIYIYNKYIVSSPKPIAEIFPVPRHHEEGVEVLLVSRRQQRLPALRALPVEPVLRSGEAWAGGFARGPTGCMVVSW